jgi:hypothetical protein
LQAECDGRWSGVGDGHTTAQDAQLFVKAADRDQDACPVGSGRPGGWAVYFNAGMPVAQSPTYKLSPSEASPSGTNSGVRSGGPPVRCAVTNPNTSADLTCCGGSDRAEGHLKVVGDRHTVFGRDRPATNAR